jgi:tRNA (guanosine-2'-O-)-methyltransferase
MTNSDDQVLTELENLVSKERLQKIDDILSKRTDTLTLVLDNISHLHNISAVIRSAEAFGLTEIHLINDTSQTHNDLSGGVSLGAEKWIKVTRHKNEESLIQFLKDKNFKLVALLPPDKYPDSIPVSTLPFEEPLALMLGNEVSGLRKSLISQADINAYIPMYGFVESFNISVACAITLFCSTINSSEPKLRSSRLSLEKGLEIRKEWIRKSIKQVDLIEKNLVQRLTDGSTN